MSKRNPVDADLAKACVKNYEEIFKGAIDPKIVKAYTSDVVFDRAELIDWLNTLTADNVRISLGVYTEDFVAKYPTAEVNRVTTFVYEHDTTADTEVTALVTASSSKAAAPFNLGALTP